MFWEGDLINSMTQPSTKFEHLQTKRAKNKKAFQVKQLYVKKLRVNKRLRLNFQKMSTKNC